MPFVVAGDPDLPFTGELIRTLAGAGADLVEVGVPFSDPVADGPVITGAYTRALRSGVTLRAVLDAAPAWTATVPVVLMLYYNLLHSYGVAAAAAAMAAAGIAGAIVPDLPPEESAEFRGLLRERGLDFVVMLTPATPADRAERIARAGSGFLYYVSLTGVTGARAALRPELRAEVTAARRFGLPVGVGFGVARPEHVAELSGYADGIIVGSALIRELEAAPGREEKLARAKEYLASLAAARTELTVTE